METATDAVPRAWQARRLHSISSRHDNEQQGVQEAHMMQAMEFNSAWSQNMTEFEHQAAEIEEQVPYLGTILSIHSAASQRALC